MTFGTLLWQSVILTSVAFLLRDIAGIGSAPHIGVLDKKPLFGKGKNRMNMAKAFPLIIVTTIILVLVPLRIPHAEQNQTSSGERLVVCMIQLEHADAENLASVLKPFLSPQGRLSAYAPTNTLIIKDRASIVNMLAKIIKGKPCTPTEPPTQTDPKSGLDKQLP